MSEYWNKFAKNGADSKLNTPKYPFQPNKHKGGQNRKGKFTGKIVGVVKGGKKGFGNNHGGFNSAGGFGGRGSYDQAGANHHIETAGTLKIIRKDYDWLELPQKSKFKVLVPIELDRGIPLLLERDQPDPEPTDQAGTTPANQNDIFQDNPFQDPANTALLESSQPGTGDSQKLDEYLAALAIAENRGSKHKLYQRSEIKEEFQDFLGEEFD